MENEITKERLVWPDPALIAVIALTGLMSLIELPIPPGRDQGIFLYHGWGLIEGLVPYRDMWDHKPPGIYLFYAVALALFGHRYVAINVLDIIWRLVTVGVMFALGKRLYGRREGLIAALFYGIWAAAATGGYWWTAQAEGFMVLFLAVSVLGYYKEKINWSVFNGMCVGAAILLKTTAVLMLVFLLVMMIVTPRNTWEPRPKRSKIFSFIYGVLIIAVPTVLYFAFSFAMDDAWRTLITFNLYHSGVTFPISEFFRKFWMLFYLFIPFWIAAWVAAARDPKEKQKHVAFLTLWLAVTTLMVLVQRKYFLYHYFVIIAPGAILAARGLGVIVDYYRNIKSAAAKATLFLAVIYILIGGSWWFTNIYWHTPKHFRVFEFLSGKIDKGVFFGRFIDPKGDTNLVEYRAVATYVRDRTKPDEKLLVWGFEPLINFWAKRFAPTRFNSDYPLTFNPDYEVTRRLRETWRAMFLNEIGKNKPTYIAVAHKDVNALETESSDKQMVEFPEFESFLKTNYRLETTIVNFDLYRKL